MEIYGIELNEQEQDFIARLYNKSSEVAGQLDTGVVVKMFDEEDKTALDIAKALWREYLIDGPRYPTFGHTFDNGFVTITENGLRYVRVLLKRRLVGKSTLMDMPINVHEIELDEERKQFMQNLYAKASAETGTPSTAVGYIMFEPGDKKAGEIAEWLELFGFIARVDKDFRYRLTNVGAKYCLTTLRDRNEHESLEAAHKQLEGETSTFRDETSSELFIVHGYDDAMTHDVAHVFTVLGFKPIILRDMPHKGRTVIEELVGTAEKSNASFAVILLSPEDMAYQKDEHHPRLRARPRARQNSIFELGYFTGKLGRENVVAIHKEEEDFEMLADYSGVTHIPYDGGEWKYSLVKELRTRGYHVAADKLYE